MRVLLLMLLVIAQYNHAYEVKHRPKIYGELGSGTVWLFGGVGASYTAEISSSEKFFHAVTTDIQFLGIMEPSAFEFNLISTYGLGWTTKKNTRLIVDILGVGFNLRSDGYYIIGEFIAFIPPVAFIVNFPGIQVVFDNHLYLAWRNNFSVGHFMEYKSYVAIGYDFSKLFDQ